MTKEIDDKKPDRTAKRQPYRVRLPGFVTDEELGLGDAIKHVASYFGAHSCGGCDRRRVALNHWLTFDNGRRR